MTAIRPFAAAWLCVLMAGCANVQSVPSMNRVPQVVIGGGGGGCSGGSTSSLAANFNGTSIRAGSTLWFTSVFKLQGSDSATISMTNSTVTIDGAQYFGPDSTVAFVPNAPQATLAYGGSFDEISSQSFSGNTFLDAIEVPLPNGLPGGIKNVTWNAQIYSSVLGVKVQWQWAAAAYTQMGDYDTVGVKPSDDPHATIYANSDHAGTPENFKTYVIGGATGGGGSNYTGSYSGTLGVEPALCSS